MEPTDAPLRRPGGPLRRDEDYWAPVASVADRQRDLDLLFSISTAARGDASVAFDAHPAPGQTLPRSGRHARPRVSPLEPVLPPRLANFVAGNAWSLRARPPVAGRAERAKRVSPGGTLVALALLLVPLAIILLPQATPLVYAAWMFPMAELALMLTGLMFFRHRFRENEEAFTELIIQITTAGHEQQRVEEIIAQIRGYHLDMPHRIWVVTEPHDQHRYSSDLTIQVPSDLI